MPSEQTVMPDGEVLNHHPLEVCEGQPCPLHNPSDHEYRHGTLDWHDGWKVMVRHLRGTPGPGDVTTVIDPDEYKIRCLNLGDTLILENSARCLSCGEQIFSDYRWDFVSCKCGRVSVDGGHDYLKRGWTNDGGPGYEDTSITYTKEA